MRAVLTIVALMAAGLGASGLATRYGDRQLLTPPPDAVLESFIRQVSEGRYDMAVKYLSGSLAATTGANTLRAWFEPQRERFGDVNGVDAQIDRMNQERAYARAIVEAERGSLVLKAPFVWEFGGWRVAALPEEVRLTPHPPAR
jgi:hypothetical protein